MLACYYWGGNDTHFFKLYPIVTVPFGFHRGGPIFQRAKEKQQYRLHAKMIFQIIKNNIPRKYFELYIMESDHFCLRII